MMYMFLITITTIIILYIKIIIIIKTTITIIIIIIINLYLTKVTRYVSITYLKCGLEENIESKKCTNVITTKAATTIILQKD